MASKGTYKVSGIPINPGNPTIGTRFLVHSGTGNDVPENGLRLEQPFATLDYAIGKCTANQGDIIDVLAGHAETISAAGGVTADVAGITVNCLGEGATRPTFTMSATGSSILITAASFKMSNFVIAPSVDAVTNPVHIQAADCDLDFEVQDASATVECERAVLTTAAADRLKLNLKYRGYLAGNAVANAARLVGVDSARINVDFYGVASTAIVEFHTTDCHDIDITGKFYNNGTSLTKNVVDTSGTSTWSVRGWDGNSNSNFSGGDNAAIASDDVTALASSIAVIDEFHDVPAANNTLNAQINEVIGNKTDAAAAGAVTTTDTLVGYTKQVVTDIGVPDATTTDSLHGKIGTDTEMSDSSLFDMLTIIDEFHDVPAANNVLNAQINEVIGNKTDAAAAGAVTTTDTIVGYTKQIVTDIGIPEAATTDSLHGKLGTDTEFGDNSLYDMLGAELKTDSLGSILYGTGGIATFPGAAAPANAVSIAEVLRAVYNQASRGIVKSVASITTADLFVIAGGCVKIVNIIGYITTACQASANNTKLVMTPTGGTATDLCSVLDVTGSGQYGLFNITGTFANALALTVTAGVKSGVQATPIITSPGTLSLNCANTTTGAIDWYIEYVPMDLDATVVAA